MKKIFMTFGGGSENYIKAGKRLHEQVSSLELFDKCHLITDNDLKKDTEFCLKHENFINSNKRGYGFWIWKSYLIHKFMKKLNNGDVLLYLDAGCEVNIEKKQKIKELFEIIKRDNIIGTTTRFIEKSWTKRDIFIELGCDHEKYWNSNQHQGGVFMFLKCDKVMKIIEEWKYFSEKYNLIDNSPSKNQNFPEFQCNRNDQSLLSLLIKKHQILSKVSLFPYIEVSRNRSGKSKIKYNHKMETKNNDVVREYYYIVKNNFRRNNLKLRVLKDTFLIKKLNHDQSQINKTAIKKGDLLYCTQIDDFNNKFYYICLVKIIK